MLYQIPNVMWSKSLYNLIYAIVHNTSVKLAVYRYRPRHQARLAYCIVMGERRPMHFLTNLAPYTVER